MRVRPSWIAPAKARNLNAGNRLASMFIVDYYIVNLIKLNLYYTPPAKFDRSICSSANCNNCKLVDRIKWLNMLLILVIKSSIL